MIDRKEAERRERCRRLLSGELGRVMRPASELLFNYEAATRAAQRAQASALGGGGVSGSSRAAERCCPRAAFSAPPESPGS